MLGNVPPGAAARYKTQPLLKSCPAHAFPPLPFPSLTSTPSEPSPAQPPTEALPAPAPTMLAGWIGKGSHGAKHPHAPHLPLCSSRPTQSGQTDEGSISGTPPYHVQPPPVPLPVTTCTSLNQLLMVHQTSEDAAAPTPLVSCDLSSLSSPPPLMYLALLADTAWACSCSQWLANRRLE